MPRQTQGFSNPCSDPQHGQWVSWAGRMGGTALQLQLSWDTNPALAELAASLVFARSCCDLAKQENKERILGAPEEASSGQGCCSWGKAGGETSIFSKSHLLHLILWPSG